MIFFYVAALVCARRKFAADTLNAFYSPDSTLTVQYRTQDLVSIHAHIDKKQLTAYYQ